MLEKEIEEKGKAYINTIIIYDDVGASKQDVFIAYKKGALDFAEPREKRIAELKNKLDNIQHYLAYDIPHELINEATNKIWHMI